MVNVRLIKIEIDRLSIIQTLNGHILRMFKDAALSGIAKSALKKITETRRKELAFANELWKSGVVYRLLIILNTLKIL